MNTLTVLSPTGLARHFERKGFRLEVHRKKPFACGEKRTRAMLFLRLDQARQLLRAAETLREKLVIRYFMLNGLSPMELANARVEHLDPITCALFLPRRHWKNNCLADIDGETVRLQIIYSGKRSSGPLIRTRQNKQMHRATAYEIVKRIALRTNILGKQLISPIVLKRTFAREWIISTGNVGTLQKQFSHKNLWSTCQYLRFVMEDVKPDHRRLMNRVEPSPRRNKKIEQ